MTTKPRIAIIVSSTRKTRFADIPTQWIKKVAEARGDMDVEVVDLRDHPLPFFDELSTNAFVPSQDPEAVRWQQRLATFDGFIFVVAEYNFAITGALKNALDQAFKEWNYKPFTAVAYGSTGGVRALENLRTISNALKMVTVRSSVHIGGSDLAAIHPTFGGTQPIEAIEANILPSANAALDELVWWTKAMKAGTAAVA